MATARKMKKASQTPEAATTVSPSPVTAQMPVETHTAAKAVSPSPVSAETVEKAVKALLKWRVKKSESEKPQLLEQDEFLYLILTLKKIPTGNQTKPIKLPLPKPLYDPENDGSELCLIVDDRSKSQMTKAAVKRKVEEEKIPVSKILKLSKLKSDYRPFEAKRKLCDSYDLFLADRRVIPLLPKMLGKQFFRKRKIPVAVDLEHQNWKEQVERACGSAMLYLRTGTCCVLKVGRVSMGTEELVQNVVAAICGAGETVPRKWGNVRSLHLKLLESLALPVYQKLPDVKLKIEAGMGKVEEVGEGKKTAMVAKVEVKKKKKGRISNVMHIDDQIADLVHSEDSDFDIGDDVVGMKRKKGDEDKDGKVAKKVKKTDSLKAKKVKEADCVKNTDGVKAKKVKKSDDVKAKKVKKSDDVKAKKSKVGK